MQVTKELIQNIGKIFEKGLQDDYLSCAIEKMLNYEKLKTSRDVKALRDEIAEFEKRYSLSSEAFFSKFRNGELGDSEDYFEWSAIFQMYSRAVEKLKMLEGAS